MYLFVLIYVSTVRVNLKYILCMIGMVKIPIEVVIYLYAFVVARHLLLHCR